ncbi:MAG: hypothetical protein ABSG65_02155 [Bryobacteraceae bacterium]|jgi:hypothetical protein
MTAGFNLAEYYHWEETSGCVRIYMHSEMADRLQAEVLRGADGGAEAGGILLGRTVQDGGRPTTIIDDFVPVPCSHADGPLYALSGADTPKLEAALLSAALAGCESPDAPAVIGYYRSHMRDGLSLSASDLLVIESYFQAPASVFLLIKTAAGNRACTAGFFVWEDGVLQSEFSSLEVALALAPALSAAVSEPPGLPDALRDDVPACWIDTSNGDLPDDLADLFRRAALTEPSPVPEFELSVQQPLVTAAARTLRSNAPRAGQGLLLRAATISIASLALVISVVTYLGAPRPQREEAAAFTPATSALGLQVARNPPDLLLTWNRNAREVATARRASLSIRDGNTETTVNLDKSQLAIGNYLHTAATDDIRFRLEIYGPDDGSVAQSIRVSLGSPR